MVDGNLFVPLSPPTSPRMSTYHGTALDSSWQEHQSKLIEDLEDAPDNNMALVDTSMPTLALDMQRRPMLRSHKTFPHSLRTSGTIIQKPHTPEDSTGPSPDPQVDQIEASNYDTTVPNEVPIVTFGGSAPASPVSNVTPSSDKQDHPDDSQDLNGLDIDADSPEDDEIEDPDRPLTAAELRAQKRKMKRFRLTHNQTRFLMSEFARQAHPDAAHRERLSREIPGLSPRQVQVWFQNRRAKLKRLTSDDRERMMRSRALPEDFDMTQALHSPFGSTTHTMGTPLTSPSNYTPAFPEGNMIRPLNLEGLRRASDTTHLSPTGITPAFGGFNFTQQQSVGEALSPTSPHAEASNFAYSPVEHGSPRRTTPLIGPVNPGPVYSPHPNIPRLQLQDRLARSRSDSLCSPLRTSVSYAGGELRSPAADHQQALHSPVRSGPIPQPVQRSDGGVMPYGLGYNYSSIPGFQASSRMRSYSSSVPRRIDLNGQTFHTTRASSSSGVGIPAAIAPAPQTATFPHYASSPLAAPHHYAPLMSAPHHVTSFQNSFLRPEGSCASATTESFSNVVMSVSEVGVGCTVGEHESAISSSAPPTGLGIHTGYQ